MVRLQTSSLLFLGPHRSADPVSSASAPIQSPAAPIQSPASPAQRPASPAPCPASPARCPASPAQRPASPLSSAFSLGDIELLSFYSEPACLKEAIAAGFTEEQINRAQSLGYLVEYQEQDMPPGGVWETYNLQRAACLMYETIASENKPGQHFNPAMQTESEFSEHFQALLARRTERFFLDSQVSREAFDQVVAEVHSALKPYSWLSMRIVVQGVEGLERAVYSVDESGKTAKTADRYQRKDLLECVHGQWWLNGGGFCCFFVVDLRELANRGNERSYPGSYVEMILLLGQAGQVLLNAATVNGLGSWMTPAVSESIAAKILGLSESEEALYFFKVGVPDRGQRQREEKRSPLEH